MVRSWPQARSKTLQHTRAVRLLNCYEEMPDRKDGTGGLAPQDQLPSSSSAEDHKVTERLCSANSALVKGEFGGHSCDYYSVEMIVEDMECAL